MRQSLNRRPAHLRDTKANIPMFTKRVHAIWEWSWLIWCNDLQRAQTFLERSIFLLGLTQYTMRSTPSLGQLKICSGLHTYPNISREHHIFSLIRSNLNQIRKSSEQKGFFLQKGHSFSQSFQGEVTSTPESAAE